MGKLKATLLVVGGLWAIGASLPKDSTTTPATPASASKPTVVAVVPDVLDAETDEERIAWIAEYKSVEQRALGKAKDIDSERRAFEEIAIAAATANEKLKALREELEGGVADKTTMVDPIIQPVLALETAELTRQKAGETDEERRLIAKYVYTHSAMATN